MTYCAYCKQGHISPARLATWRDHDAFQAWCRIKRIHGAKGLDPAKATVDDVMRFLDWERAWSDSGCPG